VRIKGHDVHSAVVDSITLAVVVVEYFGDPLAVVFSSNSSGMLCGVPTAVVESIACCNNSALVRVFAANGNQPLRQLTPIHTTRIVVTKRTPRTFKEGFIKPLE